MRQRSRLLLWVGVLGVVIALIFLEYRGREEVGDRDPIAFEASNALIRNTMRDDEKLVFPH